MADSQLPLAFPHEPALSAADLIAHSGIDAAMRWLERGGWPGGRLALWGGPGVGKTHLLHVWARERGAVLVSARSLADRFDAGAAWPAGPLALDDADAVGTQSGRSEEALLHLLNAAAEAGWPVLMAAREPPARWRSSLPDLRSRLRATHAVALTAPEDDDRAILFGKLLAERQISLAPALSAWLLQRLPRTAGALSDAAARLDYAALAAKSGVSRALATECLADLLTPEAAVGAPS